MDRQENSRTSLFLMELIVAVMFFALASAICLRLFVSAHLLSEKDRNLGKALVWSQNLSESFYASKGRLPMISVQFDDAFVCQSSDENEGSLMIFFDENWNIVDNSQSDASYEALIVIHKDKAQNVYSDVNEYDIPILGNAAVGDIAIIDLRGDTVVYSEMPKDSEIILFKTTIDTYIGNFGDL